jgi:HTH-type transcriptional regulator/antitoxin HipB
MKEHVIRTPKQLGPIVQSYRKARDQTQVAIGERLGVPQSVISKLELDPSPAAFSRVFKLLAALELELVVRSRARNAPQSDW